MAIRQPLRRDLMSRSHQTVSGMLLNRVLTRLGYKIIWSVEWGVKYPVEDLAAQDDAAKRARDDMPEAWNHPSLCNVFDVAATLRTSKIPVVTCWPTCHGGSGDMLAQVGATPMRCYPQAPGLFHRPFGSTQTRYGTPWPNIVKVTAYNKIDHLLRAWSPFQWQHPQSVGRGVRNCAYVRGILDHLATPAGTTLLKRHGLGLRMEARANAQVRASAR